MKSVFLLCCSILLPFPVLAATITGKVVDPSGAGVNGARLVVTGRLGGLQETSSDPAGYFRLDARGARLEVTAPGFERQSIALGLDGPLTIELQIAPVND